MEYGNHESETRESVLQMLSDEEIAAVNRTEATQRLREDDEYLDLDRLVQGVQMSVGLAPKSGSLLPKKAIREETWNRILERLHTRFRH
jgi:hypothetical protein